VSTRASRSTTSAQVSPHFVVRFIPHDGDTPTNKLADAELHFFGGALDGLKLVGFGVWQRPSGGRNVTVPARQYSVNGETRSSSILRPIATGAATQRLVELILQSFTATRDEEHQ